MLHSHELVVDLDRNRRLPRSPAIPVLVAMAVGILADRQFDWGFQAWWMATAVTLILTAICFAFRFLWGTSILLLLTCAGLGGTWHHWSWSCRAENDISQWTRDSGQPIRLRGKIIQAPAVLKTSHAEEVPWQAPVRTMTVIQCRALIDNDGREQCVDGRARLSIAGKFDELAIGDLVDVAGILFSPPEPSNPGEFDVRHWMRSQGLRATVVAEFPEAVRITGQERTITDWLTIVRSMIRNRADELIARRMSSRTAPVAQSMLLGSRVDLDPDLRRAFAESGTLHVLAISGMNVGLLWMWLWYCLRALRCSPVTSLLVVMVVLPAYTLITDANPPVVRATVVALVLALGQLTGRQDSRWNSLAIAALLLLMWNPADLFNPGAQLSFLAVVAILLTSSLIKRRPFSFEQYSSINGSLPLRMAGAFLHAIVQSSVVGAAIWILTSPLIASQFNLVSPIAIPLNVLLGMYITVMFWFGYLFLLLGLVSPTLFAWFAVPFDWMLGGFLSIVEFAAQIELGHTYIPTLPGWWTAGLYTVVTLFFIVDQIRQRIYWSVRAVMVWIVIGLACAQTPASTEKLSCTVLSVGHGLAVLVELPNGRTLLYDAGSLTGGSRAARTIQNALWANGKSRLGAVVISHADADHCNALSDVFDVVSIKSLMVHRTFLDWKQPVIATVIDRAEAVSIPITLLSAGQSILLDPEVSITVLHPEPDYRGSNDNANSLVLCIEFAGKCILLTGDLERDGQYRWMQTEPIKVDVMLSPHHGSATANSRDLARWTTPEWLIASCRDDAVSQRLAANFGPSTTVLTTAKYGAIRCEINSKGEVSVNPYKRPHSKAAY